MTPVGGRDAGQERVQPEEPGQRDLRRLDELEPGTLLARRHPFRDDGTRAVRQRTEENPFSTERGQAFVVYWKRLAILPVPRIVDGDRA
jgi:hypothetical protein